MPFTSSDERSVELIIALGEPLADPTDARIAAHWFMDQYSPAVNRFAQTGTLRTAQLVAELGDPESWTDYVDRSDAPDDRPTSEVPSPRAIVSALVLFAQSARDAGEDERCDGEGTGIDSTGYYQCPGCSACEPEGC